MFPFAVHFAILTTGKSYLYLRQSLVYLGCCGRASRIAMCHHGRRSSARPTHLYKGSLSVSIHYVPNSAAGPQVVLTTEL